MSNALIQLFFRSGRSNLENGDEGDFEVELPHIPKMEIFNHPMSAAQGDIRQSKGPNIGVSSASGENASGTGTRGGTAAVSVFFSKIII